MVDLGAQFDEIEEELMPKIHSVLRSTQYINGDIVKEFVTHLQDYLSVSHVIPCGNGTDALQIALMSLEMERGSEVILPAFTYAATVEVIALLGMKPVFVDVNYNTFNIDVEKIERAITEHTRVILPVNLYGQSAHNSEIMKIAKRHNLTVICDNAQSLGSTVLFCGEQVRSGVECDIACTSFYPSKNLGAYGDGGAIYTNDPDRAEQLSLIANHGQSKKYIHEIVGVNSRLDSLQAAILDVKLKYLDKSNARRQQVASWYDSELTDDRKHHLPTRITYGNHIFHQYTLKITNGKRDALRKFLASQGVPTMIYYPLSLHQQPAYRKMKNEESFPISEQLCSEVLSLPMHPYLTEAKVGYISRQIKAFHNGE